MRSNARITGNIDAVRRVEDCIRATRRYTKGIHLMEVKHPVQGEDFPSRKVCEFYEVYPDNDLTWDIPVGQAFKWAVGNFHTVKVTFTYDYRTNKAEIKTGRGEQDMQELRKKIPGFRDGLDAIQTISEAEEIASTIADAQLLQQRRAS